MGEACGTSYYYHLQGLKLMKNWNYNIYMLNLVRWRSYFGINIVKIFFPGINSANSSFLLTKFNVLWRNVSFFQIMILLENVLLKTKYFVYSPPLTSSIWYFLSIYMVLFHITYHHATWKCSFSFLLTRDVLGGCRIGELPTLHPEIYKKLNWWCI